MNLFRRLIRLIPKRDTWDAVGEPVRPHVTPDPERAAELQRRRDALDYRPVTRDGFLVSAPEDTQ